MNRARWSIVASFPTHVLIRDDGPWDKHPTVTNDAERVVRDLAPNLGGRRLFYIDSTGDIDELVVRDGRFTGFRRGYCLE